MSRILIIHHSQTGNTTRLAREAAAGVCSIEGATCLAKPAREAGLKDLLACDGLLIGSPEYFGYMSGLIKDFFDRTYEDARERKEIFKKPYGIFISAGNDGSQAALAIERICLGYPFKKVAETVICRGEVTNEDLKACFELGGAMAAGCGLGIF
jgi:multimeric flavodoxin WrbA